METYENLVGNQEDWANYVTTVEMRDTVFLDWLPLGPKPVNVIRSYQADAYTVPRQNSHVDGQPWTTFKSAGDSRGRLKALIQWFDNTTSVSKLTEDVSNPAGIADELARDIPKRLKEMATDMEANYLEDWDGREDNKVAGYLTRAVGSWISSSAQSLYPVPPAFLTPSASIDSTASASFTENIVRNIFQSIGTTTKTRNPMTGFLGPSLKRAFSDFQFYLPGTASTATAGSGMVWAGKDRAITRAVDTYTSDFGPIDLVLNYWLAGINGTATMKKWRGYFLHQDRWEMAWNQKPKVYRPEFMGGAYTAAMDALCMLCCLNPAGEGKYAPTT